MKSWALKRDEMDAAVGSGKGRPEMMGDSTAVMLDASRGEDESVSCRRLEKEAGVRGDAAPLVCDNGDRSCALACLFDVSALAFRT